MTRNPTMQYATNLRIGVKASPQRVFDALTEPTQLARWWTSDTRGSSAVGSTLEFRFGTFCQELEVMQLEPAALVEWKATSVGASEWAGTVITFAISSDDVQTVLRFRHAGWRKDSEFFAHCAMKWATFLLSFKDFVENDGGLPAPRDLAID